MKLFLKRGGQGDSLLLQSNPIFLSSGRQGAAGDTALTFSLSDGAKMSDFNLRFTGRVTPAMKPRRWAAYWQVALMRARGRRVIISELPRTRTSLLLLLLLPYLCALFSASARSPPAQVSLSRRLTIKTPLGSPNSPLCAHLPLVFFSCNQKDNHPALRLFFLT